MAKINEEVPDQEFDVFHKGDITKTSLSDFRGKWLVMLFYPADFTFVCPTELEDAAHHYAAFQKLGAELLSVSTDTAFAHMAWHESSPAISQVQYPMAADPTGKLCKEFGTYIEDEGLSLRGTFIIDPDGVLKSIEINDNNFGRNAKETLRKLQAASFVRENKGKVCPAAWQPGENTLEPGTQLVGKI